MSFIRGLLISLLVAFSTSFAQAQSETVNVGGLSVTFTTIDVPGAMNTNITGINNLGQMVGSYLETTNGPATGFLFSNGSFTFFNYPGGNNTLAYDINDSGLICGTAYLRQNTSAVGFLYDGTNFTKIRAPGKTYTYVNGMNNEGALVGGQGQYGGNQGFELLNGKVKNITPPGAHTLAYATGVNSIGEVVGWTDESPGFIYHNGQYETFVVGDGQYTEPWDVNDNGIIVGWYSKCLDGVCFHAFATKDGKTVATLDYPGAVATVSFGINNAGQIVGSYTFDQQTWHGFVTSPIVTSDF